MHIGIDLDNTILDATAAHLHFYNLASGRAFTPADVNDFYLYRMYGWNKAEREAVVARYGHDIHWNSIPYPLAAENIRELYGKHRISVITARPLQYKDVSVNWLERYEVPYHEIYFVEDKLGTCTEAEVDVLIDDGPHYAEAFARARRPVILIDQPYNGGIEREHIYRARDWQEVRQHLTDLERRLQTAD
ncbi:hypothetical protein GXP70_05275 [Paenibacillus lycopersici]|uniref:Nucleotidase n=1 Tax=Paenibacillus lycopersici TaxID=2704462 RepID=A0A6C0FVE7_9BACL|nr:hypothetical protein [Paenibacillus lycopersici]QHT59441.1 hypothetical protein GXP70_05275 [Paenibacillus lycopersici]